MTYSSTTPCPDRVLPSTLHTSHCTLHSSHSKLQTSHSTLHTPHFSLLTASLRPSHSKPHTSHFTLHTSHFTVHTSHFTLRSPHFTLHTSHSTLHSPHFTLLTSHFSLLPSHSKPHTSHFTLRASHSKLKLHTPHFSLPTASFTLHTSHFTLPTASFALQRQSRKSWFEIENESSQNLKDPFFCHMYAIRSWFLVRFVTTQTETKIKWHRHSAVCNSKWKATLLKHSNSDSDAVHNNAHPALGSQTRVDPSAANKSLWQPSCSHSNTIYEVQLQKTIVLPMQPRHEATLTQPFTLRERSYSCKAQWNSIGNSSTSTTCNPIYIAGTILQLQITMEFCRPQMRETQVTPHLQCGTDPRMIRPWSETDPTTHETVSQPSQSRGTSSRFGDGLCIEKHRLSCICYLSKTHFVRDFLQNSIGNSSTSTTCNPIYSEGTILELQITMEFHRQLIHQHHLQSHLHSGNDPTVANHNGILSTTHARKTVETPFTMRNRSETNPPMIRPWSDHTRDRLATVAPQR